MKTFFALIIFISLAVAGLGIYLIAESVINWTPSHLTTAKIIFGSTIAVMGTTLFVAVITAIVSDKVKKHRMKNKGGKK